MAEKTKNPASEILDEGLKNYEQALRAGLKLQEEAGKYWIKVANQSVTPQDFQKQISSFTNEVIPAARKSMDDCIELIEQNSRTSVDLLKKGLAAAQQTSQADAQAKAIEFCESSLKALKANAQAVVDINTKAVDSWFAFVKRAAAASAEARA